MFTPFRSSQWIYSVFSIASLEGNCFIRLRCILRAMNREPNIKTVPAIINVSETASSALKRKPKIAVTTGPLNLTGIRNNEIANR